MRFIYNLTTLHLYTWYKTSKVFEEFGKIFLEFDCLFWNAFYHTHVLDKILNNNSP